MGVSIGGVGNERTENKKILDSVRVKYSLNGDVISISQSNS